MNSKLIVYKQIVDAKLFIDNNYHEKIDLNNISNEASFSKYHFLRVFKKAFGKSPHQYLTEVRLFHARKFLEQDNSVTEVCFSVGFESVPSFVSLFKRWEGITPMEYQIRYQQLRSEIKRSPLSFIPGCFSSNLSQ